jgi:hypothetical protein
MFDYSYNEDDETFREDTIVKEALKLASKATHYIPPVVRLAVEYGEPEDMVRNPINVESRRRDSNDEYVVIIEVRIPFWDAAESELLKEAHSVLKAREVQRKEARAAAKRNQLAEIEAQRVKLEAEVAELEAELNINS